MKLKILLLLSICFNIYGYSQTKDISGIYEKNGFEIHIDGNKFSYIFHQLHNPVFSTDTLAYCSFEWENKDFILLNSINKPYIWDYVNIQQSVVPSVNDSIEVVISIPTDKDLRITIHDELLRCYELLFSKENKTIKLPVGISSISICIEPKRLISQFLVGNGAGFSGITELWSPSDITIEENVHKVSIEFPVFDPCIFERQLVISEYAKVSNKAITWKGRTFKKKK